MSEDKLNNVSSSVEERIGGKMKIKGGLDLNVCGIYLITCILTGKVYVGSSVNVLRRYRDHINALEKGKHPNYKMQSAYNDHPDSFYFSLAEQCELKELIDRENCWIQIKDSVDKGFNIRRQATNNAVKNKKLLQRVARENKDRAMLEEFCLNMLKFTVYKDYEFPENLAISTRGFNITPKKGATTMARIAKFSRMLLRIMDEMCALPEGNFKLHYINYIKSEGRFDFYNYIPKKKNKAQTSPVYDRFVELIIEDLSWSKAGQRCLKCLEMKGIDLRKCVPEDIQDLYCEE